MAEHSEQKGEASKCRSQANIKMCLIDKFGE